MELKPCPFCGGEQIKHCEKMLIGDGVYESDGYCIWCVKCGVEIHEGTKEEAFDTWNKRTYATRPGPIAEVQCPNCGGDMKEYVHKFKCRIGGCESEYFKSFPPGPAEQPGMDKYTAALAGALAECNVREDDANKVIDAFGRRLAPKP